MSIRDKIKSIKPKQELRQVVVPEWEDQVVYFGPVNLAKIKASYGLIKASETGSFTPDNLLAMVEVLCKSMLDAEGNQVFNVEDPEDVAFIEEHPVDMISRLFNESFGMTTVAIEDTKKN